MCCRRVFFYSLAFAKDKPEMFVQLGYSHWVTSVAFSPNGKYVVLSSKDNTMSYGMYKMVV